MKSINKIPVFEWFYQQGDVFLTVLTGGSDSLKIPPQFFENKLETFVVGNSSTPNLTYDEIGITTPMRFGKDFFQCFFPWDSIIVMNGPAAVIQFITEEQEKKVPHTMKPYKKPSIPHKKRKSIINKGHLKVVK